MLDSISVDGTNLKKEPCKGNSKHTDGQVWGRPLWPTRRRVAAFDVSIVNPTAVSHSGAAACAESFLNPNAGTRNAEKTKTDKYGLLCQQRGMDFVPIIFTTSGGDGGAAPAAILESALD